MGRDPLGEVMMTKEERAAYDKVYRKANKEKIADRDKKWYYANVKLRHLENKTRMTIQGKRYRLGNTNHPYNELYVTGGIKNVFEAMGLLENTVDKIKKEVLALYDKHVHGEVYIITNPAWDGWVKIGMAVDAEDRLKSYQTSSPLRDYVLYYSYATENRRKSEAKAHRVLEQKYERRNEWFLCTPSQAVEVLNEQLKHNK
jgi:hypothetical protein|tara:strand:+ start:403 stop:1005 length:603 start_codon:yes stop_codon:yes gene_type:complete